MNLIIQARQAFGEGQFPLRVAPFEHHGWRYPIFQFYSSFPYTVGALIYRFIFPHNPYRATKALFWLTLVFAGFSLDLLARRLKLPAHASLIAATSYMVAPYVLFNLVIRSHITELIGQALIPLLFWSAVGLTERPTLRRSLGTSLIFYLIATTHHITFVYGNLFLPVFLILRFGPMERWNVAGLFKRLLPVGVSFAWGVALAAYVLVPVFYYRFAFQYLAIVKPFMLYFTPLASLLAPCPVLIPNIFVSDIPPHFVPAIGVVFVTACALGLSLLANHEIHETDGRDLWRILIALFIFSFLISWSPVDFWQFIPKPLWLVQFPFRFITYSALFGSLMLGLVLAHYWPTKSPPQGIGALMILGLLLSAIPWIQVTEKQTPIDLEGHLAHPTLLSGYIDYLYRPRSVGSPIESEEPVPTQEIVGPVEKTQQLFHVARGGTMLADLPMKRDGFVQLPILNYPKLLDVKVNGAPIPYRSSLWDGKYEAIESLRYRLLTLRLNAGENHVAVKFRGAKLGNTLSVMAWALAVIAGIYCLILGSGKGESKPVA